MGGVQCGEAGWRCWGWEHCSSQGARPPGARGVAATAPQPAFQEGIASWYGPGFHGRRTSSGETYNQYDLTAAHRTLPLGTWAVVTNLDNGRSVRVWVNDRGPYVVGRVIDLSYGAAHELGMIESGTVPVRIVVLGTPPRAAALRRLRRAVARPSRRAGPQLPRAPVDRAIRRARAAHLLRLAASRSPS